MVLVALLLAAFMINLDTTIVNVALPTLVRELHASTVQLVWIVDAYNLMFAALVLAAGNLGDRVGRKGVLLVGLLVFGAASFAGGLGTVPGALIAARAVMGLGAALIFPATLSLLTNVFTERRERARAIGLWGASTGVGIAVGLIIGGWLLERFSWSSVFFALVRSPPPRPRWSPSLYRPPAIPRPLPPTGPGCCSRPPPWRPLIYTIIEAPNRGWTAGLSVAGFALAAVLFAGFIAWERHVREPMLDIGLFRNLRFSAASGAVTITFFALMGFIFVITLYFQFLKGYGPLSTGIRLLPVAVLTGVTSVVGTRLAVKRDEAGRRRRNGLPRDRARLGHRQQRPAPATSRSPARWSSSGRGSALTSAPATESIMGAVSAAKAGVSSAVRRRDANHRRHARGRRDRQHLCVDLRQPPRGVAPSRDPRLDRRQRSVRLAPRSGSPPSSMRPAGRGSRRGSTRPPRTRSSTASRSRSWWRSPSPLVGAVAAGDPDPEPAAADRVRADRRSPGRRFRPKRLDEPVHVGLRALEPDALTRQPPPLPRCGEEDRPVPRGRLHQSPPHPPARRESAPRHRRRPAGCSCPGPGTARPR